MPPLESLHDAIRAGAGAVAGAAVESVKLEQPPRAELGDYSTNAPLLLAPRLGIGPREGAGRGRAARVRVAPRRRARGAARRDAGACRGGRTWVSQPLPAR